MVKDWKTIAKASGLDIADQELDRIAGPLNALEETFRPLAMGLKAEHEPATRFSAMETA